MQPKKISYIKKPFARRSLMSVGLAAGSLILGAIGVVSSVMTNGGAQLNVAAVCFCSLLLAAVSFIYGILSFFEKEKKYILSRISMVISGLILAAWTVLIIIGLRG